MTDQLLPDFEEFTPISELRPYDDFADYLGGNDEVIVHFCQGNLFKSYNMAHLRHLVVRVANPIAARQFLYDVIDETSDGPHVTTARNWENQANRGVMPVAPVVTNAENWEQGLQPDRLVLLPSHEGDSAQAAKAGRHASTVETWDGKPATCLNVGITATGLKALGLNDESYNTFPEEFRQGAARRATKVGDIDGSDPTLWRDGFANEDMVHLMWTVHSGTSANLDAACAELEQRWQVSGAFSVTSRLDGAKLPDEETGDPGHDVHFGYRDDISQPRFQLLTEGIDEYPAGRKDRQPLAWPNSLIHGGTGPTSFDGVEWQVPELVTSDGHRNPKLSQFGCYNAFRVMEQDVDAFESFLESESVKLGWNKEYLAAKLMGRWRNGVPIVRTQDHARWSSPNAAMPVPDEGRPDQVDPGDDGLNEFDFADELDLEGRSCPVGSHIRRSNPRRGRIVQRSANHTRPIARRGMPYGPPFDPDNRGDGERRGLLGSFFCGSLLSQFESMMYDWINLGLQDPRITGTNCPIVGANRPATSRFEISLDPDPADPDRPESVTIRGFPRFVETVGAAYFFYPGLPGLWLLATMK